MLVMRRFEPLCFFSISDTVFPYGLIPSSLAASPSCSKSERKGLTQKLGWFGADFKTFFGFFGSYIAPFGARRGFKMILSYRAPSCLNMSSYRVIWTQFSSNSMILVQKYTVLGPGPGVLDLVLDLVLDQVPDQVLGSWTRCQTSSWTTSWT